MHGSSPLAHGVRDKRYSRLFSAQGKMALTVVNRNDGERVG
jgi:hypothetical protein